MRMLKRTFDMSVATLLLLLLSPVFLTVMLALKLQAQTSVFNLSPRVGQHGKPFRVIRFKTMIDTTAPLSAKERLTKVGRFIRNYSIDDLPNLVNVLRGDMSVIGPRPTEPDRVDLSNPAWQQILSTRPGCFSYAVLVLSTTFNRSSPELKLKLELDYVQNQSFSYDLQLMGLVFQKLIASRGNVKARGNPENRHYDKG
jgi:lipopolysaccharide/colanic/teichoic acid biosynthesis glycosyltransferase